jgi:hypothetical protein
MPRSPAEITLAEHVALLADILDGREGGSFDTCAGTSDEDLLYAVVEVRDAIPGLLKALTVPAGNAR